MKNFLTHIKQILIYIFMYILVTFLVIYLLNELNYIKQIEFILVSSLFVFVGELLVFVGILSLIKYTLEYKIKKREKI
ncbi:MULTISPECIES: hypothetical protein [unclassified Clostridioides]|uniref:hypothetical protein n=1 Tax=unclassified Clostridioides TaxID=2635829 RepID=UPI001D12EC1D|nr:hypothetical protein [Clostridioides sp. ZZV14-6048]MCC0739973.1 hypothetical protein [Clostridioides sp. ZZV14-5902]